MTDYDWPAIPYTRNEKALYSLRCALIKQRFELAKARAHKPLYYTVPLPPGFVLEVEMPADLRGAITYTKGVKLVQPTLYVESMRPAA